MLVYGDRTIAEAPRPKLGRLLAAHAEAAAMPPGLLRHQALVAVLIEAGEMLQGLADARMEQRGCDNAGVVEVAAMALTLALARQVGASWDSDFASGPAPLAAEAARLEALPLPEAITIREPEGYAFYALYPEALWAAGRSLPQQTRIIGLRSIGTSLAAMVAAGAASAAGAAVGAGAAPPVTLRPIGDPFRRALRLSPALAATLPGDNAALVAIVDEGPGLSGSSFGAVADFLEDSGVAPGRIVFLPGHAGEPGAAASLRHRTRWSSADRRCIDFEILVAPRLAAWVADLTGPAIEPVRDLSGGQWRKIVDTPPGADVPVDATMERRKYLLRGASGDWLLKFVGLGRPGEAALALAQALDRAGFGPATLGLRHGFLVQRWEPGSRPLDAGEARREPVLQRLGRYLAFRARHCPMPPEAGADLPALADMAAQNIAEALGAEAAEAWRRRARCITVLPPLRRVATDNRLQLWEWLWTADGRLLKTDGLDHHRGHDLIGAQDVAWDVAGAVVEFGLDAESSTALAAHIEHGGIRVAPPLVDWLTPVYLAFQTGASTFARQRCAAADAAAIEARGTALADRLRDWLGR